MAEIVLNILVLKYRKTLYLIHVISFHFNCLNRYNTVPFCALYLFVLSTGALHEKFYVSAIMLAPCKLVV